MILNLPPALSFGIGDLFHRMEEAYDQVAEKLSFSCKGCPDNCCDSYFQHHTYLEWAYLWQGMEQFGEEKREEIEKKAADCVLAVERALAHGERPQVMCPLNESGLCILYAHRLMICRMHGVPSAMVRPDGKRLVFPGCFRCQEEVAGHKEGVPEVDRTAFYRQLVDLEHELLGHRRHYLPRVKMTIAQMLVKGPPEL
jgi:hypothetical protein